MILKSAAKAVLLPLAERAARGYVAGPELEDGLAVARFVAGRGFRSTLAYWNDSGESPERIDRVNRALVTGLAGERLDAYASLKAPPIEYSLERVRALARAGTPLHFDALGPETVEPTLRLIEALRPSVDELGTTLPGRWRRSLTDADRAIELGLGVRVVKGQWEDPAEPRRDAARGFFELIERLAGRARLVRVATHDPNLARRSIARLVSAGTPCELELLFGLPVEGAIRAARSEGAPIRVYVPFGRAWLPYSLGRAKENPRILWWLMRDAFFGDQELKVPRP